MRVQLPDCGGALALHRSKYWPLADWRSSIGSIMSIETATVSPRATGGRCCASMWGCASRIPTEFLPAGELLPSPAAEVQPSGRPPGSLWELEGCPHTKARTPTQKYVGSSWAADWRDHTWLQSSETHYYLQTLLGCHLPIMCPYGLVWNKEEALCRAACALLTSTCIPLRWAMRTTESAWKHGHATNLRSGINVFSSVFYSLLNNS